MDHSEILNLPYIMAAQAQKHVTHNEAITTLDALVQAAVDAVGVDTPPTDPEAGMRVLVGNGPTGEFVGHGNHLAAFQDEAWVFYTPHEGWSVWSKTDSQNMIYSQGEWLVQTTNLTQTDMLGINAEADNTNRLVVRSGSSLFMEL